MKFTQYIGFSIICWLAAAAVVAQPLPDGVYTTIYAEGNQFIIELEYKLVPMTVANFVGLAEGRISNDAFPLGRPFYDGSSFDRVVPGHVLQGGTPASETSSEVGYSLPNEIHPDLSHDKIGMVGMANGGPHTANTIFYITLGDRSYLDGDYTVFGEVICFDTYEIPVNTRIDSVRIIRVGIEAEQYWPDDDMLQKFKEQVTMEVKKMELAKHDEEKQFISKNYPALITSEQGWRYQILSKGKGKPARKMDQVKVRFTGVTPQGIAFESKNNGSTSWKQDDSSGEFFTYTANMSINPGLDQVIAEMRPGAKYIVVLSPELAYGDRGYYAPKREAEERFHFSPNTTLIYQIEVEK